MPEHSYSCDVNMNEVWQQIKFKSYVVNLLHPLVVYADIFCSSFAFIEGERESLK